MSDRDRTCKDACKDVCKDGKDGTDGEPGKRGKRGHHGKSGKQGPVGLKGDSGVQGPSGGSQGPKGPTGRTGPTGPCCTGPTGATGRGLTGPTGPCCTGPTGLKGDTGDPGPTTGGTGGGNGAGTDFAYGYQEQNEVVLPSTGPGTGDVFFTSVDPIQGIVQIPTPPPVAPAFGFLITRSGTYEFGFHVRGANIESANPIAFGLKKTGVLVMGTKFEGTSPGNAVSVAEGHGLIDLVAGDVITLGNITGGVTTGTDTVLIGPATTDASVGANLFLILVQPN